MTATAGSEVTSVTSGKNVLSSADYRSADAKAKPADHSADGRPADARAKTADQPRSLVTGHCSTTPAFYFSPRKVVECDDFHFNRKLIVSTFY